MGGGTGPVSSGGGIPHLDLAALTTAQDEVTLAASVVVQAYNVVTAADSKYSEIDPELSYGVEELEKALDTLATQIQDNHNAYTKLMEKANAQKNL